MLPSRPLRLSFFLAVLVLGTAGLSACGGSTKEGGDNIEYSVSARQNYERGMKKLEDDDWLEATKYFSFVKARFPYSKYAALAELRLADASFGAGAYIEAVDAYKQFVKFHPTHEMVTNGYANFRIGEAYYKTLPEDWFLVPPGFERDASATYDALRELSLLLRDYPSSPYAKRAREMHDHCARFLASHEWYVARFYWDRDRPTGALLRLRTLLERYPGVGYDEEALWLLGSAYVKVGKPADARTTWQNLVTRFPKHPRARQAQAALTRLGAKG